MPRPTTGAVRIGVRILPAGLDALDDYAEAHDLYITENGPRHGGPNRNAALNRILLELDSDPDTVSVPRDELEALRARARRGEEIEKVFLSATKEAGKVKRTVKVPA